MIRRLMHRVPFCAAIALVVVTRAAAGQVPADAGTALQRFWLRTAGSGAVAWTNHHHYEGSLGLGGAIGGGMRLTERLTLGADLRFVQMHSTAEPIGACAVNGGVTCPSDAVERLGLLTSLSPEVGWITPAPDGSPRFVWSLGPGWYDVADYGASTRRRHAFGLTARIEQRLASGDHHLLTFEEGVTALPNVNGDVVWYMPVGLAVRFW